MDLKLFIKKALAQSCAIFTAIALAYCVIVALIDPDAEEIWLEGSRIMLFFFFSLLVALGNSLLSVKTLPAAARYVLHFLLCGIAFYICVLFPAINENTRPSFVVIGLTAFAVLYVICLVAVTLIRSALQRSREKKEEYTNRFAK